MADQRDSRCGLPRPGSIGRRDFVTLVGAGAAGLLTRRLGSAGAQDAPSKPNIIVIVSDDQGYADVGYHGCQDIPTPNIDSIAENGARFTNGYVSCPVCSPTRAGLVTGRYQQRFGHEFNTGPISGQPEGSHIGLPLSQVTIGDVLQGAGYTTGMVGKWHLGMAPQFHPFKRGFDEFFGFLHGGHSYVDPGVGTWNPVLRGTEEVDEKEYLTDAFGREAAAFIDRHQSDPFFLYLCFNAVHTPLQAPDSYLGRFPDIADEKRRTYAAMLSAMDDGIGKVLQTLRDTGQEQDTLLFFFSDNGGPTRANASINTPLRAGKGSMYEGGTRVPFLLQWPGRITAGTVYEQPVIALDVLPTAVAAAGGGIPDDRPIDGVDIVPYLTGADGTPHDRLFWRAGQNYALREGNWKLVRLGDNAPELYDLEADIGETNNLADQQADVVNELVAAIAEWEKELVEPAWAPPQRAQRQRRNQQQGQQ
jgi:arylsulfatase A-like enzyme